MHSSSTTLMALQVVCHSAIRMLTDEACKVLIVCDDDELEVVLLTPGSHHSPQGISQAGTVLCST